MAIPENPSIYSPELRERREHEFEKHVKEVVATAEVTALQGLIAFTRGYAEHLSAGLKAAGLDDDDAATNGWKIAWKEVHTAAQAHTFNTTDLATAIERTQHDIFAEAECVDAEHSPPLRTFYQVFIDNIEHPSVKPNSSWLYDR